MRKLLIAVSLDCMLETLIKELHSQYHIYRCSTGVEALSLLETVRPDTLIIYLSLPDMNGLTVLRKAMYKPPIILAISNLVNDFVMQTAVNLGVQGIVLIPCTIKYIVDSLTQIEKLPTLEV